MSFKLQTHTWAGPWEHGSNCMKSFFNSACWVSFHVLTFSKLTFSKILSGIPSECQTAWIQFRTGILSVLIWVQPVSKSYHQETTKVTASRETVTHACATIHWMYLFAWIDSFIPVNNLSVKSVFLVWTSTKQGLMCPLNLYETLHLIPYFECMSRLLQDCWDVQVHLLKSSLVQYLSMIISSKISQAGSCCLLQY